MKIDI